MFWRTKAWSVFIASTVIVLSILSVFFILKKQTQLNASMDHYISSSTDDFAWGAEQLRHDIWRLRKELSAYADIHIPYDATKTKIAADILYSRFQTIDYGVSTMDDHTRESLAQAQSFISLRQAHQSLERDIALFMPAPSREVYLQIMGALETTSALATVFSSEALQASQYHAHQIRADMLARAEEYQASLFMMMIGLVAFIGLIWFVNWKAAKFNASLEKAVVQASDAARAKGLFLSSMSHEFRTPLNAISGYMHLILMNLSPERRESIASYESAIDQSIENMVELVDQVLELDKLQHKDESVILDTVDARQMVETAIKLSARRAITKNVAIHQGLLNTECFLETDSGMFTQILDSLISNAVKFNHDDGDVWITCEHDPDQDTVTIVIEDNGIGIPAGKEIFLFHPFERLGRESGVVSGAGTGLSICKELCDRLGVELGYRRGAFGGSMFWLTAPCRFPPSAPPLHERISAPASALHKSNLQKEQLQVT